ncbi:MAG: DUF2179 domain-containing protein [Planctomycetaceae bacterium]|nr:DUF2179 domain-containing protein [Planctomycetaceae bacterium]
MNLYEFFQGDSNWWWVLPVLIFAARVVDVSLGTLRVLFLSRGMKLLAPVVGFFEVLIWITAIAQVVRNLDNVICFFAYAGGYGLGTFVGLMIEEKLAMGTIILRVIPQVRGEELVEELRRRNHRVTCIDAQGALGKVNVIFSVIRRGDLPEVLDVVKSFNPQAFYTVEDVRRANGSWRQLRRCKPQPQVRPLRQAAGPDGCPGTASVRGESRGGGTK